MKKIKQGTKEYNRIYQVWNRWSKRNKQKNYKIKKLKEQKSDKTMLWIQFKFSINDIKRGEKYYLHLTRSRGASNTIDIFRR